LATRAAFSRGGCEALRQAQKRQRSRRVLTAELEQQILETTLKTRPPDATHWSVRDLARQLRVSRMMVHRVWQRYDVQPHRVEKFKLSNDPQFEEKVRDVVGLYLLSCPCARACRNAKPTTINGTGPPPCLRLSTF
jgi:putative transposase